MSVTVNPTWNADQKKNLQKMLNHYGLMPLTILIPVPPGIQNILIQALKNMESKKVI